VLNLIYKVLTGFVDRLTHAAMQIDEEHGNIHDGIHFFVSGYVDTSETDLLIEVPADGPEVHLMWRFSAESETSVSFYRGTDADKDGTELTIVNNNFTVDRGSQLTVRRDPTINSVGSLQFQDKIGATNQSTASIRAEQELVLRAGEKYLFRITPTTETQWISWRFTWYEYV